MDFATVVPPYVAKPLTLSPFRAVMLAPARVGDPASARALARPYRDVAGRLLDWIGQGWATEDTLAGALPPRVHRRRAHGPRPRRSPRRVATCGVTRRPSGVAARGDPSRAGRRARGPDAADEAEPGADPPGAPRRSGAPRADLDRGTGRARLELPGSCRAAATHLGDPRPGAARGHRRPHRCHPVPAGRRTPPLRRLPQAPAGAARDDVGRRPGDAGRPAGHSPVPGGDPPHPGGHDCRRPASPLLAPQEPLRGSSTDRTRSPSWTGTISC